MLWNESITNFALICGFLFIPFCIIWSVLEWIGVICPQKHQRKLLRRPNKDGTCP